MARTSAIFLTLTLLFAASAAKAGDTVNTTTGGGYARLLFTLTPQAHVTAAATDSVLTLTFDRKVALTPASLSQNLGPYVGTPLVDADGATYRFPLNQRVKLHSSVSGDRIAIDLAPTNLPVTPPDLPPPPKAGPVIVDPATLPTITMRVGTYHDYTRLVFDWPAKIRYGAFGGAGKLTVRFEAQANIDVSALARQAPPWVKKAAWHRDGAATLVEFDTDVGSGHHNFLDGSHVVLDVLAPKTDADAIAKKPTVSPAQAQEIAATAAKLAATAPPQLPAGKVAAPTPDAAAAPPAAPVMVDNTGKVTHEGAQLVFIGASERGAAVFIRGLTAWIVLQGAPPFDVVKLKASLGSFPEAIDASSADGVSILRLILKQPEQIAALADGSNLKVVIAPQIGGNASSIDFARNQDDATHSSLTTLLPAAIHAVTLNDPMAGDTLIVVPSAAGRAILQARDFAEFRALKSACGLVLAAKIDNLSVGVAQSRVTITRPGGLSLSPPIMPMADSPEALAQGGNGATYLDFVHWRQRERGDLLDTERRLRATTARLPRENANHARMMLTQFFLANDFDAEALGVIKIMQLSDPALQSDRQLLTMRAAANYEMGRYRDAHNDIAGAEFDSDRHAALWRGLTEAALENWSDAERDLASAAPVMKIYPPEWQARAKLARAQSALARNNLEIADAALARLPEDLPRPLMLEAQLTRARLYSSEDRQDEAKSLFDAVENSNDGRLSAQAVYYRIETGVASGAIPAAAAIEALEKFRYRWRGVALELDALRKLGSLYFAKQHWREGLRVLRVAATSFSDNDFARQAQDDMRAAFVDLFLKGKADKMPPIEALALFYDFIDLTPIGAEGDEMIRRMADRLVAVDLLGPAADLLKYQIDKRLDGVGRSQVAATLASIYLMDTKPAQALEILQTTRLSTLPDTVNHQRMLMEAEAQAALKHWDNALELIAVDPAADTASLRADIYWQSGNWAMAGQLAEQSLANRWSDAVPLTVAERRRVMRSAVAYSMASDQASLDRLRAHFGPKMGTSPDASGFNVVSDRIESHGLAFHDAAAQIASIDALKSFMKDMRAQSTAAQSY